MAGIGGSLANTPHPRSRSLARVGTLLRGGGSTLWVGGGLLLVVATAVVNASNFLFHVLLGRLLGPADYGALGAVLGVLLVLAIPVGALQLVVTRDVAAHRAASGGAPPNVRMLIGQSVMAACALLAIVTILSPFLSRFLHLDSNRTALLIGLYLVPIFIGLVPKGILLGELRFRPVAVALVAGSAVRLTLGAGAAAAGFGVDGAVGATVLGELVVAVLLLRALGPDLLDNSEAPLAIRWRSGALAIGAFAGFWLLTAIDAILARHYLTRVDSGYYVAAATAARVVLFLPGAIALIAFPRFASATRDDSAARHALVQALTVVGFISISAATVMVVWPELVVEVLFGDEFGASTVVVGTLAIATACASLIFLLVHYHLARRTWVAVLPWLGTAAIGAGIVAFHSSMEVIALSVLAANAIILVVMLAMAFPPRLDPLDRPPDGLALWDLAEAELDLTIVVPFYNPGPRLRSNVDRIVEVLRGRGESFEVIAVSDGCTDRSEETISEMDHVRLVVLPQNAGKGQALRVGLSMARGRYLGFIDADGDLDAELLSQYLALMALYEPDFVVGSKRHPMSEVEYPAVRRVYSWGYQQVIRVLFRLNVRDTQTGVKLARREVLAQVLPRMVEKRFAFDLELFVVARRLGYQRVFEAPVRLKHQFTSTISMRSVLGILLDTLAIFYRLRLLHFYDVHPEAVAETTPEASREVSRDVAPIST